MTTVLADTVNPVPQRSGLKKPRQDSLLCGWFRGLFLGPDSFLSEKFLFGEDFLPQLSPLDGAPSAMFRITDFRIVEKNQYTNREEDGEKDVENCLLFEEERGCRLRGSR